MTINDYYTAISSSTPQCNCKKMLKYEKNNAMHYIEILFAYKYKHVRYNFNTASWQKCKETVDNKFSLVCIITDHVECILNATKTLHFQPFDHVFNSLKFSTSSVSLLLFFQLLLDPCSIHILNVSSFTELYVCPKLIEWDLLLCICTH